MQAADAIGVTRSPVEETVSATTTSLIICAILIGGALSGVLLRRLLPDHHLDAHAKDIVRLGCALIATITGLVLGLLINSGKNSFDAQRDDIRQLTAKIEMLDYLLDEYGPQARPAREELRRALPDMIDRIWDDGATKQGKPFVATAVGHTTYRAIAALSPTSEAERTLRNQALELANTILQTRLILHEQSSTRMPLPFLVVLVFWLYILFASFCLFSPLNPTAFAALAVIALSASGAIFLILELYRPFSGLMQIESGPLRQALAPLAS
jgi:hypothetical protein